MNYYEPCLQVELKPGDKKYKGDRIVNVCGLSVCVCVCVCAGGACAHVESL